MKYALGDFAVRQAALTLGKGAADIQLYGNRSLGFKNVWDQNVTSDGFTGFSQRRFEVSVNVIMGLYVLSNERVSEWHVRI